jgi:hypothetical protein
MTHGPLISMAFPKRATGFAGERPQTWDKRGAFTLRGDCAQGSPSLRKSLATAAPNSDVNVATNGVVALAGSGPCQDAVKTVDTSGLAIARKICNKAHGVDVSSPTEWTRCLCSAADPLYDYMIKSMRRPIRPYANRIRPTG